MQVFPPTDAFAIGESCQPSTLPPAMDPHLRPPCFHRPTAFLIAALGAASWLATLAPAKAQRTTQPSQVQVESRFVEVNRSHLQELGVPMFRTGEVQLNVYGLGGTGHGQQIGTDKRTVKRTETISETTTVRVTELVDIPGIPGLTPVDVDRPVTNKKDVTVKKTVKRTTNKAPIQGGFGGAGVAAKFFVTPNIGLGVEGDWLEGDSSMGTVKGTVTARFPMGANAPYVFGGAGVQFGGETMAIGTLGVGVEHRFSPHCGMFADAAWLFGDHENLVVFRTGVTMAFGPGAGGGSSGGGRTVSWGEINPIMKEVRP